MAGPQTPLMDDFAEANASENAGGLDLALVLRRKWWVMLGATVGAVLALMQYSRTPPVYEARAQILIQETVKLKSFDPTSLTNEDTRSTAINHAHVMATPKIVELAVAESQLHQLRSLAASGDPVDAIRDGLRVAPLSNDLYSGIYTISYRGSSPDDCQDVIDAMVDTYREFLEQSRRSSLVDVQNAIAAVQKHAETTLKNAREEYKNKTSEIDPLPQEDGEFVNTYSKYLTVIRARRDELMSEKTELEARLKSAESDLASGVNPLVLLNSLQINDEKSSSSVAAVEAVSSSEKIKELEVQLAVLKQSYGRNHTKVRTVEKELLGWREQERLEAEKWEQEKGKVETAESGRDKSASSLLTVHLDAMRSRMRAIEQELRSIKTEEESRVEDEKRLAKQILYIEEYKNKVADAENLYKTYLSEFQSVTSAAGEQQEQYRIDTLEKAGKGYKVAPSLTRFLGMGLCLGLMGGLGIAYLIDRADRRLTAPEDVADLLPVPVVGQIPSLEEKMKTLADLSLAPELIAAHQPKSPAAEAFRVLRTAIFFGTRGKTYRVIQVTSAMPGDGKSTLIANLSVSIAQSGKRVLLIDADLRKPVQHKRFQVENKIGLMDVIEGSCDADEAIQRTSIENLSVLTSGRLPSNPAELLSSPQFKELLESLREKFQFILVDTPPVLAVSDPCAVAARVDGVLLAVRMGLSSRDEVAEAFNSLQEMDATVMGTVVNGLEERKRYGYGYRYGYGRARYGYGYRSYGYRSYLDAGPTAAAEKLSTNGNGTPRRAPDRHPDDEFAPIND